MQGFARDNMFVCPRMYVLIRKMLREPEEWRGRLPPSAVCFSIRLRRVTGARDQMASPHGNEHVPQAREH